MSLKKQLDRYKKHLEKPKEKQGEIRPKPSEHLLEQSMKEAAVHLGADMMTFENETIIVKEQVIPLAERHGIYPLEAIHDATHLWQGKLQDHPLSAFGKTSSDLLFFDTETTGLAAGAGHLIFLLGCGFIQNDSLVIKQYFLPGPGHETAFYYHFLSDIKNLSNLVTFNGKSFDWPRVKSRIQFVRETVPKLPAFGHYDLLHVSRRLWKNSLESTRLQVVEENIVGFQREGDVPGHMAPFLYFQFLKSPKASLIEGIFRHNADDIKTLVTLYTHLSRLIHRKGAEPSPEETYEIARWHAALGFMQEAIMLLETLTAKGFDSDTITAHHLLAKCYKKAGEEDKAFVIYKEIAESGLTTDPDIFIETAKFCEHRFKDIEQAIHYSQLAMENLEEKPVIFQIRHHKNKTDIEHRLKRLMDKQDRVQQSK